jgi:hypothetical protein
MITWAIIAIAFTLGFGTVALGLGIADGDEEVGKFVALMGAGVLIIALGMMTINTIIYMGQEILSVL